MNDESVERDRVLVRPYVPEDAPEYRLPEGPPDGEPDWDHDPTDQYEQVDGPAFVPDPTPMPLPGESGREAPVSHVHPDSDRRQMSWLIGSGLALVVAVAVTMIALWPESDEEPPPAAAPRAAAPPAARPGDQPQGSAGPSVSASAAKASISPSASGTKGSAAPTTGAGSFPVPPPAAGGGQPSTPASRPPATLAPPPAADRTGPIVGPSGNCLDTTSLLVVLGADLNTQKCDNTTTQRFTMTTDGTLKIGPYCAHQNGGKATVRSCNDAQAGQWRAGPNNTLVNVGSGECLTASGDAVTMTACGKGSQAWTLP